ncbi:DEAD/DEAH box helicase [Methanomicrobiaceae archaeon CYW5]|uniref:DEAD/DEAH box helicase n=1 Tax=Methanovulcanius yangii TaxID=1789227 RepID=UPI0029CA7A5D|nr:DEAD/DEAH box helicase [Methanovulcanius yangii]MBT8507382.1 DEAD/DEAH box helicase [Methanovulcanius yangii]
MSALDLLSPEIRELVKKREFDALSETQEAAIPAVLDGGHLLLIAPTGTGKTESAMLPVFDRLSRTSGGGFRAIYITPLRSLNRDILGRLTWWCRELGLTVGVRHGDTLQSERRKQALNPPDLLITTPETLQALFLGKRLREHLKTIEYVVIDEIHELAGSKRGAQLSVALERLVPYAGEFQRIGLSATVGNPSDVAKFLCGKRPSRIIDIPSAPHMQLAVRFAGEEFGQQTKVIDRAISADHSTLLFVNTRSTAEALGHQLYDRGDVEVHHGSLSKEVRVDAEDRFREGKIRTLICTSSMELGIDIGHIGHVLQFGSPREVSRLLQRVGRAGHRLDTVSEGTILATGFDDLLESLVISRRARQNASEDIRVIKGAGDVMANQIAGLAMEYGDIPIRAMEEIFSRSACFCEHTSMVREICEQMASHRLIWMEKDAISRSGRCRTYMYANLSMIPDERKVQVFDIVSRRTVGTLDESFVVGWIHTGAVFITKGQAWQVIALEDGKIKVEPAHRIRGELPSWEGEQIPVPYEVAQEAGRLRRTRAFRDYGADSPSVRYLSGFLDDMETRGYAIASDRLVTLEHFDEGVVLNICGGHKANEALARVLSVLLSARFGSSVGIEVGAYRILFRLPSSIRASHIQELLETIDPAHIEGLLSLAMKRTAIFKWKIVQVAKKFGAIDADADYERISIHRLLDLFEGTAIQKETYRELFTTIMDVAGAQTLVEDIRSGTVEMRIAPLSPLGSEGLSSSRDLIPPPTTDDAVLATIRRRLEEEEVVLFCMHCKKWKSRTRVSRITEAPVCPVCGARLIAALKPWDEELISSVKKTVKTEEDSAVEKRLMKNANIVLSSGKTAIIALSARGVGPDTASRIIATMTEGDDFYREILKAERNYIKTHRFW